MKKTLLLLAMIASTASFAGNMVKLSADSSVDFSSKDVKVPTDFAAELSMEKVAGTGLSFGGKLADKTDLYNLSLTKDSVLDGKANLWAKYEGEVKGIKGSAKFSVDLARKEEKQGFKLFYDEDGKAKELKADNTELSTKLDDTFAREESFEGKDVPSPTDLSYADYEAVKKGDVKKFTIEKKATIETALSKDFMINDSATLTSSFNTKTTFEFAKEAKPETVFTLGLGSKLNDGNLGLTLETDNNYKNPNAGFKYVSGKLAGAYKMFDAEAFVKYNFGKQTAVALNDDSTVTPAKTDRTDKLNELKVKAKLDELTDNKDDNGTTYKDKYEKGNPKSLKDRIKDASKELKLSDSAFLEDYVQAHTMFEKSGFSVEGKLKFSNALTNVAEYKVASSDATEIMLNDEKTHSMQEYMPELMLNLGYKASNGLSVELNNDLAYRATVKTGYEEEGTGKEHKLMLKTGDDATTVEHNLRYFGEVKTGYSKDFASFAFETTNGISTILNADLHNKPAKTEGSEAPANTENTTSKQEKEFGLTSAVVEGDSSVSLTAKVTDKVNVTPSLSSNLFIFFNTKDNKFGFEGVREVLTPKVSAEYMPLEGLKLGSYVSTEFTAEYDNSIKDFSKAVSNNFKTPTVKFGGSLQYNW